VREFANRKANAKAISLVAKRLVLRQAASSLPEDSASRELEGNRRLEQVVLDLVESGERRRLKCQPGEVLGVIVQIVQAIYTLLKDLGIINENGSANA
jgi:hypothetical protein